MFKLCAPRPPLRQAAGRYVQYALKVVNSAPVFFRHVVLDASEEMYAEIAEEICLDYTTALRSVAVEDEPNPAKLKWNC